MWCELNTRVQFTCMDFPNSALRRVLISLSLSLTVVCHSPVKTEAVLRRVSTKSKEKIPLCRVFACVCVCVCALEN